MIRKFNYTGRKRVERRLVSIDLDHDPAGVPTFTCQLDLAEAGLPGDARVYVEAYSRFGFTRLPFGTVSRIAPPPSCRLPELQGSPIIRFRVKVIDEAEQNGRILAVADGISPRDPELDEKNRMALLPVQPADLDQVVWKVEFEQDGPVLLINRGIEGAFPVVAGNGAFQSLVFPAAVRQILWEVVGKSTDTDPWSFPDDWQARWLRYAMRFVGEEPPSGEDAGELERLEWVETVVRRFSDWMRARDRFNEMLSARSDA